MVGSLNLSQGFWEKMILLTAGALLTGILVPTIKAALDYGNAARKLRLEADMKRQSELITAQIVFFADCSTRIWRYLFLLFRVSYSIAWENDRIKQVAWEGYELESWEQLMKLRATMSKASRLLSQNSYNELWEFYDWLLSVDDDIALQIDKTHERNWKNFHEEFSSEQLSKVVDEA